VIIDAAYGKYLSRMDRPPAPMVEDIGPHIAAGQVWVIGQPALALICLIETDGALLIDNVAVHPDAQGGGHGRALMDLAEQEALRRGLNRVWLYTNEVMTENLAIYQHLGYVEFDRRLDDGYQRIYMEKLLAPRHGRD
jgi:GNAT superfamily N-acetyltransferase